MTDLRAVSYGGGVQSTALLVLAAEGVIDYPLFLMSNVGEDSEHPATLEFVREHARPYAAEHGIELVELQREPVRGVSAGDCDGEGMEAIDVRPWSPLDGVPELEGTCPECTRRVRFPRGVEPVLPPHRRVETLLGRLTRPGSRSLPIPVRMDNGAPGTRSCTMDFKIRVIGKELRRRGATEANPATVAVGFSTDELHRANRKKAQPWEIPDYPLLDLGHDRSACMRIIADAGLPVPPKSACFFCPFHRPATWAEMRRDEPELFNQSVQLERLLNARRDELGRDHVYLTRFARPLDEAIAEAQPSLFGEAADGPEACDEGHCWT